MYIYIYIGHSREKELSTLRDTLVRNGYPRNFISPNKSKVIKQGDAPHMAQKKPVFIT